MAVSEEMSVGGRRARSRVGRKRGHSGSRFGHEVYAPRTSLLFFFLHLRGASGPRLHNSSVYVLTACE